MAVNHFQNTFCSADVANIGPENTKLLAEYILWEKIAQAKKNSVQ